MRKLLLAGILLTFAAAIAYRWDLFYEHEAITERIDAMAAPLAGPVVQRGWRIRQLHEAIASYRDSVPVGAPDVLLQSFGTRLQWYADVMSAASFDKAVVILLSERRESAHQYGFRLYKAVLGSVKAGRSVIRSGADVARLYKDGIWLGKCHGHGLSDGVSVDEMLELFRDGQAYCWSNRKEEVSWFTFEQAVFLAKYAGHDRSIAALEAGLPYLGHDPDRDGSVLHEYGMALMRKARRDKNPELLPKACEQFAKAVDCKLKAGNDMTPLYSGKMELEALGEYYVEKKMRAEFLALAPRYVQLAADWEAAIERMDADGRRALPEVYQGCALSLIFNGNAKAARVYLQKGRDAVVAYDPGDAAQLADFDSLLQRVGMEGGASRQPVTRP